MKGGHQFRVSNENRMEQETIYLMLHCHNHNGSCTWCIANQLDQSDQSAWPKWPISLTKVTWPSQLQGQMWLPEHGSTWPKTSHLAADKRRLYTCEAISFMKHTRRLMHTNTHARMHKTHMHTYNSSGHACYALFSFLFLSHPLPNLCSFLYSSDPVTTAFFPSILITALDKFCLCGCIHFTINYIQCHPYSSVSQWIIASNRGTINTV